MADEIEFSSPQLTVYNSRKPITLNMAGQRAGKSHLIGFKSGVYVSNAPKIRGMIAANTYMQLTQSTLVAVKKVWKDNFGLTQYDAKGNPGGHYVINLKPPAHFHKFEDFDNYRSIISFINGAIVFAASLDNYMAHDGKEIGWAELDETKDTKEEALKAVILARLSQPGLVYHKKTLQYDYIDDVKNPEDYLPLNPCCINTSPAVGVVKWLTDMFKLQDYDKDILKKISDPNDYFHIEDGNQAVVIYSTYHNEHNLPSNYIDVRLSQLSEGEGLKYVFGYPFARTGDNYFRNFEKSKHVRTCIYDPSKPIHVTFDFNSKPYMTEIAAQVDINEDPGTFDILLFKEYCFASPKNSTEDVCDALIDDYGKYDPFILFYGDASGDYRQAGSGDHTQFDTVRRKFKRFISNSSDRVPPKNRNVLNRRDFIDRILEFKFYIDYQGKRLLVRIFIDPSCTHTVDDFQWLKEGLDGKLKEKVTDPETKVTYEKFGHTSDAVEYLVCELLDDYYE